jgi:hypothetical protein
MLNSLLYHFEYASITSSIEHELLKEIAKDPKINRKAFILRIVAIVNFIIATAVFIMSFIPFFRPLSHPDLGIIANLIVFDKPRWISEVGCASLGMISSLGIIWTTFYYNRVTVLSALLSAIAVYVLGGLPNIFGGIIGVSFSVDDHSVRYHAILMGLQLAAMVIGILTFVLLYKLRAKILADIPVISISNLNAHLDEVWQAHPHSAHNDTFISTLGSDSWTRRPLESINDASGTDSIPLMSDIDS